MPGDAHVAFGDGGECAVVSIITCRDAEVAAGAIALDEATAAEREAYRLHLSNCLTCVEEFGGEREIERTAGLVTRARDAETWQPAIAPLRAPRRQFAAFTWGFGAAAVAAAAVATIVAFPHAGPSGGGSSTVAAVAMPAVRAQVGFVARPSKGAEVQSHAAPAAEKAHSLIVVHNVVKLAAPTAPAARHASVQAVAAVRHPQPPAAQSPSSSDERTVADTGTTNVPAQSQHAESLAMLPSVVRDVAPVGGENAIAPRPARIAYYENAEGTTAVDISIDDRGSPVKCTVTKPSGFVVLDDSVCVAAMRVRYLPRMVNGRAVAGVYHDAFTFQSGEDGQSPP
jgi:TonB family protein